MQALGEVDRICHEAEKVFIVSIFKHNLDLFNSIQLLQDTNQTLTWGVRVPLFVPPPQPVRGCRTFLDWKKIIIIIRQRFHGVQPTRQLLHLQLWLLWLGSQVRAVSLLKKGHKGKGLWIAGRVTWLVEHAGKAETIPDTRLTKLLNVSAHDWTWISVAGEFTKRCRASERSGLPSWSAETAGSLCLISMAHCTSDYSPHPSHYCHPGQSNLKMKPAM